LGEKVYRQAFSFAKEKPWEKKQCCCTAKPFSLREKKPWEKNLFASPKQSMALRASYPAGHSVLLKGCLGKKFLFGQKNLVNAFFEKDLLTCEA